MKELGFWQDKFFGEGFTREEKRNKPQSERKTKMKQNYPSLKMAALFLVTSAFLGAAVRAEQPFSELVGPVRVGDVSSEKPLQTPFILWGGDIPTFYANGGLATRQGSIFNQQGLNLKLVAADDFLQQVRDYMSGKSPFLRGTFSMIGQASEIIGSDPRTKGVVILHMTWSQGDHLVVRGQLKTVSDLKGKTITLQTGGPHVGFLDDVLKTAGLTWDDIKVVWVKDLTASDNSPATLFRSRSDIDGGFVVTPDMIGLTGGLQASGSGAEGTVKGARVLVSTAELSRSIADVYVCRKDFYDANRDLVTKFVAGYLKACEEVIELKKGYEANNAAITPRYVAVLQMAQDIYGKKAVPTLKEDAHGLICDAIFVGYDGNVSFFTDKTNLHGFEPVQKAALDLATSRGYAKIRCALFSSGLDYASVAFTKYLSKIDVKRGERFRAEAVQKDFADLQEGGMDERTIYTFTINFEANQNDFSVDQYGAEFDKVVRLADKYAGAVIAVRGHSDPTKTLAELVKAGMQKGGLKRTGSPGKYQYSLEGKLLDLGATKEIIRLIEAGAFDGVAENNPRDTMQSAMNLSLRRAEAVRDSIVAFATKQGLKLDQSQIQPVGVGIREPFIVKPANMEEAKKNMRVEFSLVRVPSEVVNPSDFDF